MEQQDVTEAARPTRMKFPDKPAPEAHRDYLDMDTDEEEFGHQETPEPLDEAPPEPEKPQFTTEELDRLVKLTKRLTLLPNLSDERWNVSCLETIRQFFREPTQPVLTIFFRRGELTARLGFPRSSDSGLAYFLREARQVYRADDFAGSASFGSLCERSELALLRLVEGLYAPLAFQRPDWPRIARNRVLSDLNELLARATELAYRPTGLLLLYAPWEAARGGGGVAMSPRERVQLLHRLDRVANTWIRRIREVLARSPAAEDRQLHDLDGESDFWQARHDNLACVAQQLASDRLQSIARQLKEIGSPSVERLELLACKVDEARREARSNLNFLRLVLDGCRELDGPARIQERLSRILLVVRFVWTESPYYRLLDNIERLLCSLSVYVVKICIDSVDLNLICDDSEKCKQIIAINLQCCYSYAVIYENAIDSCMQGESAWNVDKRNVLKSIKAFEHRCRDVSEICDAILIYSGLNKINFGGTKGNHHEMQYNHVKDHFIHIKNNMRVCCNYALDITEIQWFRDMSHFRNSLAELESTIKHLFIGLFEEVKNVNMGVETLYTFLQFKEVKGFQDMLHDQWTKVWEIFYEEIKLCLLSSLDRQIIPDQVKFPQSEESMITDIHKNYLLSLRNIMVNASDWLGDCDIQHEVLSKFS
ncbi:uncharacterized protein LOC131662902 [Phymastichus coffea]|uniref:uncharacterized protein LOC131662902 n=1 Tax=Phymastichus coffea TaxID=108790 RepID=UPI00273C39EA|nr:uncharacterized protein LOC131662902 [Phymastichus coffea]